MSGEKRYLPEPTSAPGDFYVVNGECIACGIPHVVAPELVGWVDATEMHCRWKKQPEDESELQQAFAIFDSQEAGCHRYAGSDPDIIKRIGEDNCDYGRSPSGTTQHVVERSKGFWRRISQRK